MFSSLVLVAGLGAYLFELSTPQREYFLERPGKILRNHVIESVSDDRIRETLRLESSTGLVVDFRVIRPVEQQDKKWPVYIIVSGHKTGKNAVDLVGDYSDATFVAIDYPSKKSASLRGLRQLAAAIPDIQRSNLDTPPSLLLVLDWLSGQEWVDPHRIELLGISMGVPFAAVAGALDNRFSRVWLIHGGADNVSWVMHVSRDSIENQTLRRFLTKTMLLLTYGKSFETPEWIREIAPRPLVIIAARNDEQVPPAAQQPFIEAAESDNVELIWTSGLHVHPDRPEVLQLLMEIVIARASGEP